MGRSRRSEKTATSITPTPEPSNWSDRAIVAGVCLLLAAMVWIVFGQTLRHEFVNFDDDEYVYQNSRIVAGLAHGGFRSAFSEVHANNWHPLTTLSHMLDCQLYGLEPWGHHLTNVLLQIAAVVLLFLALRRLTDALWPSALVAALFAVHPLRVQSVAWISERKDVLSGVFFMLALWAYARFVRSDRGFASRYLMVLVFFGLGLMCKPTLVTLPFVLLLLDYWPLQRVTSEEGTRVSQWSYLFLEKVPLLVFSVASCVATVLAQGHTVVSLSQLSLVQRIIQTAVAYVVYLVQTVYPVRLAAIYPYPDHQSAALVIFAPLFLLVVSLLVFLCRKNYPFLLVGWLWFLGMLVPMIGIVQVGPQPHADRYTYLPQIGLFVMITWGIMSVTVARPFLRKVAIVIGAVAVVASIAISFKETACLEE